MTKILSLLLVLAPSNYTKNSFFILLTLSISESPLYDNNESISSKNITLGYINFATANKVLINFSDSPIHFDTNDEAEILKNVEFN